MVRLSDGKIIKENLIQFEVVILSRMDQNVIREVIKLLDHKRHFYKLRTGTKNCKDLAQRCPYMRIYI